VRFGGGTLGVGGMHTFNVVPESLRRVYGSRTPTGGMLFLRYRPTLTRGMTATDHMHHPTSPAISMRR
jgi:hypothetical protein